ncbi:hypothetical protein D3C86_1684970 [compost metagenome]
MDRQPLVGFQDTDDAVAGHRAATGAEMDADAGRQAAAAHEQASMLGADPFAFRPGLQLPLQCGENGLSHPGRSQTPPTNGVKHVLGRGDRMGFQHRLQRDLGQ